MSAGRNKRNKLALPKIKIDEVDVDKTKARKHTELTNSVFIKHEDGSKEVIKLQDLEEIETLGKGTFGLVKKMVHKPTRLEFAVKLIAENQIDTSESRDIEVSIKLGDRCSNLIRFYGAIFAEGHYWILTEPMDTSLDCFYLKAFELKLRLPESFYSLIAHSVLNALIYMKEYRVMHRDIKPSNILLNSRGDMKVCDYGISGFLNSESLCKSFKGCHLYMAPEKLDVSKGYSIKADVWSLGISLIEIATGKHPYSEISVFFDLTTNIIVKDPPKLDRQKFSKAFCDFVEDCLMKEESQRPSLRSLMNHTFIQENMDKNMDKIRTIIFFICDVIKKENDHKNER